MGQMLASLSFIIGILFYLCFCGTMVAIVVTLRKIAKDMIEVKKAITGLEEQVALLGPRTKATAADRE